MDGTYSGNFSPATKGSLEKPTLFKAYPGERAIIDGDTFNPASAENVQFWDIEFANSDYTDRSTDDGSFVRLGENVKYINCIVHDKAQGFSGGPSYSQYEIYGCIVFYCGWDANLGHGIYVQHENQNGWATLRNNIVFFNFAYGFHLYGSNMLENFKVDRNTSFANGDIRSARTTNLLMGGAGGFDGVDVNYNRTWYADAVSGVGIQVGRGTNDHLDADVNGNVAVGGNQSFNLVSCTPVTFAGNELYGSTAGFVQGDWLENTYGVYGDHPDQAVLEPNTYDSERAHMTIFNPSQANTVQVNVSSVFNAGDTINAHNVEDYWVDIQELTVAQDGTIIVNMQAVNRSVQTPVGWSAPATTFPFFGAFVLVRQ